MAAAQRTETAPLSSVTPYLVLDGAVAAIDFYKTAPGTEEIGEWAKTDDGRILTAGIDVHGGSNMLMDPMPGQGDPAVPLDGSICTSRSTTPTAGSSVPSRPAARR